MDSYELQGHHSRGRKFGQIGRRYPRHEVVGLSGSIADGKKVVIGRVTNISTGGFECTNLPQSFLAENHLYTIVLSNGDRHYKMMAKPCWREQKPEQTVNMGFKILDASWEWVEFAMDSKDKMYFS